MSEQEPPIDPEEDAGQPADGGGVNISDAVKRFRQITGKGGPVEGGAGGSAADAAEQIGGKVGGEAARAAAGAAKGGTAGLKDDAIEAVQSASEGDVAGATSAGVRAGAVTAASAIGTEAAGAATRAVLETEAGRKTTRLVAWIAIGLVLALLAGIVLAGAAVINMMQFGGGASGAAKIEEFCLTGPGYFESAGAATEYTADQNGLNLLKFLKGEGLSRYQARIVWSVGMRESGGTPYTSATPGWNTFDYGVWQINQVHTEWIRDTFGWTMDQMGGSVKNSFDAMWRMSQKANNMINWGLAANQPTEGVRFDWSRYSADWQSQYAATSETNYKKFYAMFDDASAKAGITWGTQAPIVTTAGVSTGGTINSALGLPTLGTATTTSTVTSTVPGVVLTVSKHIALPADSPSLQSFTVYGNTVTVAREFVGLFRAFLRDWQDNPVLGQGRFPLTTPGVIQSYNYRQARAASSVSDHAGYAVDIYPEVLRNAPPTRFTTAAERNAIHLLLTKYGQLGWGGDYSLRNMDEMHFYVREGVTGDSVSQISTPAWVFGDESLAPLVRGDGPLDRVLAAIPYTIDMKAGRTIPETITALKTNARTTDEGVWVLSVGTAEAKIGDPVPLPTPPPTVPPGSPSPTPTPTEPPLTTAQVDDWITSVMNASGSRTVLWAEVLTQGASRDVLNDAIRDAQSRYDNLVFVEIPDEYKTSLVTPEGVLTDSGAELMASKIGQAAWDSQSTYTQKPECQAFLNDGSYSLIGLSPVLGGPFTDRTDVIIPGGDAAVARLESWVANGNAPCTGGPRCAGLCDHLAARAYGYGASGYKTAKRHWYYTIGTLGPGGGQYGVGNPGDTSIPIGALTFFSVGDTGHVATYVGGGYVISNYGSRDGGETVQKVPLKEMADRYGYLGWSTPKFIGPE